jgi:hypothetical protein
MDEKTQELLRKNRRISLRALPVYAAITITAGLLVSFVPRWWTWTILTITGLALAGDIINVWFTSRKLVQAGVSKQQVRTSADDEDVR